MNEIEFKKQKTIFVQKFEECQMVLSAIGDGTRQLIIKTLMEHSGEGGIRVGEIQKNTNISRTAVSHHLKILKEAGVIEVRQDGTKNFYFLDSKSSSLRLLSEFWKEAEKMMQLCQLIKKREEQ